MKSPIRIPRLLLTNDDGFDAPGLAILAEVAKEFSDDIWIVAPEHDRSGTGQSVTLNHSLRCYRRGAQSFAVSGTPGDCVIMALRHLMKDARPTYLLAGINSGGNIGDEVNLSGTLGAAFTGLMLGVPSVGISQTFTVRSEIKWNTARAIAPLLLRHFLSVGWPNELCLSINIPDLPPEAISGFSWATQSQGIIQDVEVDERKDHRDGSY
nr:5'/3'-nucleotidase SurE [Pseudomonadota bacterium]